MMQEKIVNDGKLPEAEKLEKLIEGSPAENLKLTDEDLEWVNDLPKGNEVI